ncbi:DNA-formamidopyrimidine glycosylase [Acholeplasma hippikon]|uniref:Multifunctional fusion protein n=1 Tax=Acholeplasma hippikon TaxID=264636 RepID=A0A449BJS7_9MOLU|nr:DNA-formamidopyrimidine glycosylase [Acholeplasma hippikon]VEU82643.1 formamidopyrimidine-DNA glycosylase [Acholeplasma hippikon]
MPELPEVESIRRNLETVLKGETIKDVKVFYRPIVSNMMDFEEKLIGQTIKRIDREGKYLKFILDDYMMISHLRMEGKYFMDKDHDKHTHVEFYFESGHKLSYHDTRKFGRFELVDVSFKDTYLNNHKKLALDPQNLDLETFYQAIQSKNKTIKEILLDQSIVGGIGNIYANEILYLSRIHPAKKGFLINYQEAQTLLENSIKVLNRAIELGGTTIDTFESLGHKGEFQQELNVHGKAGHYCKHCGDKIIKIQLKGRGTYFCPTCQKSHVIALTGGIASGKSTVSNYLIKKGFKVLDSDLFVRNLYLDKDFRLMIAKKFDSFKDNDLDKEKLASIIFNDKKNKKKLEKIIHPLVFKYLDDEIINNYEHLLFLDIPLLFETKYKNYDESLLVYVPKKIQLDRLMKRNNLSEMEANLRINNQMSLEGKKKLATYVINNKGTLKDLYKSIDNYLLKF